MKRKQYSMVIPSDLNKLQDVESLAEKVADQAGLSDENKDNLAIAVTEAVNNAIIHGNNSDKNKKVSIDFQIAKNDIKVIIKDEGNGFNPKNLNNPTTPENLYKESGRGIFILRTIMKKVDFDFSSKGTVIIMTMKI
ncbi:ATP-binding protein [candidate division KSB1 bacterium]